MSNDLLELRATDDGSYTLYNPTLNESYHSKFGAATESDQVFLHNSGLFERLCKQQPTSVLEIGFGTGFNFVRSARHTLNQATRLHYTALELHPPDLSLVAELLRQNMPQSNELNEFTLSTLAQLSDSQSVVTAQYKSLVTLTLINADATARDYPEQEFDIIYLDAFSTGNNPALWHSDFLEKLHHATRTDGKLATYCVQRKFRDALSHAGWCWQKLPGPKGKREVLVATPEVKKSKTIF